MGEAIEANYNIEMFVVFFSLLIILSGCGDGPRANVAQLKSTEVLNAEQDDLYQKTAKPLVVEWDRVDETLTQFVFDCLDCPPSFAHFLSMTTFVDDSLDKPAQIRRSFNCQGGLIAEDLFLTSRHCLPEVLRRVGASCDERIQVILPALSEGLDRQLVGCASVVSLAENPNNLADQKPQPDWVILKLKETLPNRIPPRVPEEKPEDEKPYRIDPEGLSEQEKLYAYIPLKDPETAAIEIKKITCTAIQKSTRFPLFQKNKSPVALLKCDHLITKGFSGTLLYRDSDNQALPTAIISHVWDKQVKEEDILISPFVLATNLACLPQEGKELDPACAFDLDQYQILKQKMITEALSDVRKTLREELSNFLADETQPLIWKETSLEKLGDLPSEYALFLNDLKQGAGNVYPAEKMPEFFHTLVPIYHRCVKKERITDDKNQRIRGWTPSISVSIVLNKDRQVSVQYHLEMIPYVLTADRDHPGSFFLKSPKTLPPFVPPKNRVEARAFDHIGTRVSVCP